MPNDESFVRIVTARLLVRRFRLSDARRLAAYRSQSAVCRFQSWGTDFGEADAANLILEMQTRHPGTAGEWFQFAVADRDDDCLIGDCGLCISATPPWIAEVGFTLALACQGRGYAAEALRAIAGYAVDTLAMATVLGVADRQNIAARRLMAALGWQELAGHGPVPPSGPLGEHEVMYCSPAVRPGGQAAPQAR